MGLILGIDTGGTYTDGVVLDQYNKKVLSKAKSPTTRENLAVGIRNCIDALRISDYSAICSVVLSTTLATNSVVEGKGAEVGLLLIGKRPAGELPTSFTALISGQTDIWGRLIATEPKEQEIVAALDDFRGKVTAVAVSGYASVRNPTFELLVKKVVQENLGLPVVCAHELMSSLGFYERTVTAVLNAKLLPIMEGLLDSTYQILCEKQIYAPLLMVRGDGCLMSALAAREKPIETILSGPAASVLGGAHLTGIQQGMIVDMGGTTTDIAFLSAGKVRIGSEGALLSGWRTMVKAAEIYTYGIGGDSYIQPQADGSIKVGPGRVMPICRLGDMYPEFTQNLGKYFNEGDHLHPGQAADCFILLKTSGSQHLELSPLEKNILRVLASGPKTLTQLKMIFGKNTDNLNMASLIKRGLIQKVGVTPTDILHSMGIFCRWDEKSSLHGIDILALGMGITSDSFIRLTYTAVIEELTRACRQSLAYIGNEEAKHVTFPIVALGAPASAWLDKVAQRLGAELIIKEHNEVASAVGAAVGEIISTIVIIIRPGSGFPGYIAYTPWKRIIFEDLIKAKEETLSMGKGRAATEAHRTGLSEFDIITKTDDIFSNSYLDPGIKKYIETRIEVVTVGRRGLGC